MYTNIQARSANESRRRETVSVSIPLRGGIRHRKAIFIVATFMAALERNYRDTLASQSDRRLLFSVLIGKGIRPGGKFLKPEPLSPLSVSAGRSIEHPCALSSARLDNRAGSRNSRCLGASRRHHRRRRRAVLPLARAIESNRGEVGRAPPKLGQRAPGGNVKQSRTVGGYVTRCIEHSIKQAMVNFGNFGSESSLLVRPCASQPLV